MRLVVDLRGLERTLLLVKELEHLQAAALSRGERETVAAINGMIVRFCADTDLDRATLAASDSTPTEE